MLSDDESVSLSSSSSSSADDLSPLEIKNWMLNDLNAKLKDLSQLIYRPGLFVSDYFYQLRNEIDLLTESYIVEQSRQRAAAAADNDEEAAAAANVNCVNGNDHQNASSNKLKQVRQHLIDELTSSESECYKNLQQLQATSESAFDNAENQKLMTSIDSLKLLIDSIDVQNFHSKKNDDGVDLMPTSIQIRDERLIDKCIQTYQTLVDSVERTLNRLRSRALNNQTFLFWKIDSTESGSATVAIKSDLESNNSSSSSSSFNFGILVIFEDVYLNETEIKYICENKVKFKKSIYMNTSDVDDSFRLVYQYMEEPYRRNKLLTQRISRSIPKNVFILSKFNEFIKSKLSLPLSLDNAASFKHDYFIRKFLIRINRQMLTHEPNPICMIKYDEEPGKPRMDTYEVDTDEHIPYFNYKSITLNFHDCSIENLNRDSFEYSSHAIEINLSNNRLNDSIVNALPAAVDNDNGGDGAQQKLFPNKKLQSLNLSNNLIKQLNEKNLINYADRVNTVNLSRNYLTRIHANSFNRLVNLVYLSLTDNFLVNLEPKTFANQVNMIKLHLNNNLLTSIDVNLFRNLIKLRLLMLNANSIEEIYDNYGGGDCGTNFILERLERLDLSLNKLKAIQPSILFKFANLKYINLSSNRIEILRKGTFDSLVNLEFLNLCDNNIRTIEPETFRKLVKLNTLDLVNNQLDYLYDDEFIGLENLKSLYLNNNYLRNMTPDCLNGLNRLKWLRLNSNLFEVIYIDILLAKIPSIEWIYLNTNRIKRIEIFNNTSEVIKSSLTNLDISINPIKTIQEGVFDFMKMHNVLTISNTRLKRLDFKTFNGLSNLKVLVIKENYFLRSIESLTFKDLADLVELDLSDNGIRHIAKSAFNCLLNLRDLKLTSNLIETLEPETFLSMKNLNSLNLSVNKIKCLKSDTFKGLENLSSLFIYHNRIESLESSILGCLKNLTVLNLSYNKLRFGLAASSHPFNDLTNLTDLDLSNNLLNDQSFDSATFQGLVSLKSLHLNDNQLTRLSRNVFETLTGLRNLEIFNNKIEHLDDDVFEPLISLDSVSLKSNQMTALNFIGLNLLRNYSIIMHMNLSHNDLVDLPDHVFAPLTSLEVLNLEFNRLLKFNEHSFSGLVKLLDLIISNNFIEKIEEEHLANLNQLMRLDISSNRIKQFNAMTLKCCKNLHNVSFQNNEIEKIELQQRDRDANQQSNYYLRDSRSSTVTTLILSFNRLSNIDNLGHHFSRLDYLYLNDNNFSELSEKTFAGLSNLPFLDLSRNQIEAITNERTFESLINLKTLLLERNRINLIHRNVFDPLVNLRQLNLSENQLDHLNNELFRNLINLSDVILSHNLLTNFSFKSIDYLFKNAIYLVKLDLSFNKISKLSTNMFASLNKLLYLNLASNELSQIDANAFTGLVSLKELHLSSNQLSNELFDNEQSFSCLGQLKYLYLDHNNLKEIAFLKGKLHELVYVFLNNNQIEYLDVEVINQLRFVKEIDLNHNLIRELKANSFNSGNLRNLIRLNLAHNRIDKIEAKAFESLRNLEKLDLSDNQLMKINEYTFDGLSNLEKLVLSNNQIESIDKVAFGTLKSLKELELNNNRLVGFDSIDTFANLSRLRLLDLGHNLIESKTTGHDDSHVMMISNQNLCKLILTNNKLSRLNGKSFKKLSKLKELYLSGNEQLREIETGFLDSLPDLNHLEMNGIRVETGHDLSFLKTYQISYLLELNLSSLGLDELAPSLFSQMIFLKFLKLNDNCLRYLSASWFDGIGQSLEVLDLSDNQLESVESDHFSSLIQLKHLNLNRNQITKIQMNAFSRLKCLECLILSNNKLFCIITTANDNVNHQEAVAAAEDEEGEGAWNLKELYLSHNQLDSFNEINRFISRTNFSLIRLDLSYNELSNDYDDLPPFDYLRMAKSLEFLSLRNNKLTNLNLNQLLQELPQLRALNVASNQIKSMSLDNVGNLRRLNYFCYDGHLASNRQPPPLVKLNKLKFGNDKFIVADINRELSKYHLDDDSDEKFAADSTSSSSSSLYVRTCHLNNLINHSENN